MKGKLTRKDTRAYKARQKERARRLDLTSLWSRWILDCMNDTAADATRIRNLWAHFLIGSKNDDDHRVREMAFRGLQVLIWHVGFPIPLCLDVLKVAPRTIYLTPAWELHVMADPSLELARQEVIEKRETESQRQLTKAVSFAVNYGTPGAKIAGPWTQAQIQAAVDKIKASLAGPGVP